MNSMLKIALASAGLLAATQAAAGITFYERDGFQGRTFATDKQVGNFERTGFNDRASSVIVTGERWEVCESARFQGRCVVLRPGQYGSLSSMGLNDRVSSVRIVQRSARVDDNRYAPAPVATHDYRRRGKERVFDAPVVSARAVMGSSGQRCWMEREQVSERGALNVPGALMGAVIGGILGHQVGSGRGNDAATVGGAVAGGAIGANVGRNDNRYAYGQDVQRCSGSPRDATPAYWDVTYRFKNQDHRVQMATAPGRTVRVNSQGEPRV